MLTDFHGFDHNPLVFHLFLTRKVLNRSSQYALSNGQGAVSPIQFLVRLMPRSNLGQTWSKLVKPPQTLGNVLQGSVLRFFWCGGSLSGQIGSVKLRSNLVNPDQTWSNSGKCAPNPVLRLFDVASPRRIRPAMFGLPRFMCRHPRKSRG